MRNKHKIRLSYFLDDINIGGNQKLSLDVLRLLSKEIFEVRLIILYKPDESNVLELKELGKIEIIYANLPDSLNIIYNIVSITKYVCDSDLIITSGYDASIYLGLLKFTTLDKRKYISIVHGIDGYYIDDVYLNRIKRKIGIISRLKDKLLVNNFFKYFDGFITVSSGLNDFLENVRNVNPGKIDSLFFGTDFKTLRQLTISEKMEMRSRYGFRITDFVICYAGRLSYAKGLENLLGEIKVLLQKYDDMKLFIVGGGELFDLLSSEIEKLKLIKKVVITGFVSETEKYIQMSDVLILPSKSESTNLGVQTAMYSRKIVLCSDVGGLPDLVDNNVNGYLYNVNDMNEMRNRLDYIYINRHDLDEIKEKAHIKMKTEFDLSLNIRKIEKKFIDIFES